jgi:hypothetical protein
LHGNRSLRGSVEASGSLLHIDDCHCFLAAGSLGAIIAVPCQHGDKRDQHSVGNADNGQNGSGHIVMLAAKLRRQIAARDQFEHHCAEHGTDCQQ